MLWCLYCLYIFKDPPSVFSMQKGGTIKEEEEKVAFSEGDPIRWNVGMTEYP